MKDQEAAYYDRVCQFPAGWSLLLVGILVLTVAVGPLTGQPMSPSDQVALVVTVGLLALTILLMWRMRVVVTQERLTILWGFLQWLKIRIDLKDVEAIRTVTFRPLRDFGGWGWRGGRGGSRCYNTSGNSGVELRIHGRAVILGVPDPAELASVVATVTGIKQGPPGPFTG
ncbi:hypothetical protein LLH03_09550 [bacterium]|nr:hypothetical protein [bacterium]